MATEEQPKPELVNVQIDGEWKQFPKGTRLIEACGQAGKFIPRYCYHPKLSSPGNCRMCLIEMGMPKMGPDRKPELGEDGRPQINWIPRPQISCAQDVAEGMAVRTNSPMVQECRNGVMEFLLINHPLDCPICDQAGECRLQEFSVEFGTGSSRFLEEKVKKPKRVQIGPRVTLDAERCILCSRCIRFCQEIADDDVLGFINRGSHSEISTHPGRELDNNYSLNTVDICPVGALTNTDFRFKMRVWFLKETKSFCTSCGTGCNTLIGSREDVVYRQTPRENNDVNSSWMCDYGRLNFHYLNDENRLTNPLLGAEAAQRAVTWPQVIDHTVAHLQSFSPGQIAIIASGRMTNEEMWLTKKLATALQVKLLDIIPRTGPSDNILLSADRNPNTSGARTLGITSGEPGDKLPQILDGIRSGKIKALLSLGEDPGAAGLTAADLQKLDCLVLMDLLQNSATPFATAVLPGSGFAEKRGSMINLKGRIQRLNRSVAAPGIARDDWEILAELLQRLTGSAAVYQLEDVFKEMAAAVPELNGLTLSRIGDLGTQVLTKEEPQPEPAAATV